MVSHVQLVSPAKRWTWTLNCWGEKKYSGRHHHLGLFSFWVLKFYDDDLLFSSVEGGPLLRPFSENASLLPTHKNWHKNLQELGSEKKMGKWEETRRRMGEILTGNEILNFHLEMCCLSRWLGVVMGGLRRRKREGVRVTIRDTRAWKRGFGILGLRIWEFHLHVFEVILPKSRSKVSLGWRWTAESGWHLAPVFPKALQ